MDTTGINLNAVGTAIRGMTAWLPNAVSVPTEAQMANPNFTLPASFIRLGLRTTDGAPEMAENPAALIELYEAGYKINPGTGTAQLTQTFAQFDNTLRTAVRGATLVSGAVIDVDVDNSPLGTVFCEDVFRMADGSFNILRKCAPAQISSVKSGKPQRGNIPGTTVVWDIERSEALGNKHFREAWLASDTTPDPVIWSISPAGLTVAGVMVVHGANFTGMTAATIGGTTVTTKSVADDATVLLTIPAGVTAGAKDVIITTPNGSSPAFSYTVA